MGLTERQFQGWVVDVFRRCGWHCWHVPMPVRPVAGGKFVPDSRGRGLPDLFLLHPDPPRLVLAELKGDPGSPLSDEQKLFLRLARAVAREIADAVLGLETEQPGTTRGIPFSVFTWRPGNEEMIEAVAKGARVTS